MPSFSVITDVIKNTTNVNDIENNPPTSTKSSTSLAASTKANASQPLSPRPINITAANGANNNNTSSFQYESHHSQQLSSSSSRYKDQIFQLNLEIQGLKQRLSLASSTSKNELLDLLSEKDTVIANKSKQINALNDKFNKITKAVNGMEREMNSLRRGKKESDDECKKINRYLAIREKEVNVLVSRCAAQEEKLNEMKGARILERELNALKKMRDKEKEDHGREIQNLMGDLQQVGNQKQVLQDEFSSLKESHKMLQNELDGSKNEVREKRDKINHLYDELKELHESKEKEATECIAIRRSLQDIKNEVFERDSEIDDLKTQHKNEIARMKREWQDQKRSDEQSLADISTAKDAEIDNCRRELELKQLELDQTTSNLKQWRRDHESVHKELTALEQRHNRLSSLTKEEAEAIENERISLENRLNEKIIENKDLNKINRQLKDENDSNAMHMTKLKEKLGFLENELRAMTEKEMDLMEIQNQKMDTISKLEGELRQMEEDKEKQKKSYQQKFDNLEEEGMVMQEEMENVMQKYESNLSQLNHDLSIERTKAENYWGELEHLRTKSLKQDELRQVEIKLLEESVKSSKAQSKSKEEEIYHLKHKELKHERERSTRLEQKLIEMEKSFEQMEMDGALVVDDLNKKLVDAIEKNATLENEKTEILTKSRKASDTLETKLKALEADFVSMSKELDVRSKQITDRDTTIANLTKEKKEQDLSVESWKGDLDMLIKAYEKCKTDHAATVKNLQNDYFEFKKKAQDDAVMFQRDYDSLQKLAAETEAKCEEQNIEMKRIIEEAAEEKKKVIDGMTECQKNTNQELKEARDVIAELQDLSESYSKETEEYKSRYHALQIQMEKDLKTYMDEIERRDEAYKTVDAKMLKMEKEILSLRAELKSTDELRATNYLLQDKVDRQEAFLKRKLEKEKKQRMIPPSMSAAPRTDPRRSRSVTRRPPEPQKSNRVNATQPRSRSHSTTRTTSAPDELEELLS